MGFRPLMRCTDLTVDEVLISIQRSLCSKLNVIDVLPFSYCTIDCNLCFGDPCFKISLLVYCLTTSITRVALTITATNVELIIKLRVILLHLITAFQFLHAFSFNIRTS